MFLKNRNISSKIKRSKVTDYAALSVKFSIKLRGTFSLLITFSLPTGFHMFYPSSAQNKHSMYKICPEKLCEKQIPQTHSRLKFRPVDLQNSYLIHPSYDHSPYHLSRLPIDLSNRQRIYFILLNTV